MKTTFLALTAAAVAIAGTAYAQQHTGRAMMDPLGDATLTRAEAQAKALDLFAKLDVNHDGKLDRADRDAKIAERFDSMDANHDGVLSKQEFIDAHERMEHERMEHEGMQHEGMQHEGGARGQHGMGGGEMGHPGMRAMHGAMVMGMLAQADSNGDHAVTRDEFVAAALKRFDEADTNHDGKLTKEERRAAFRAHMQMMRGKMDHMMGEDMPPPPPAH